MRSRNSTISFHGSISFHRKEHNDPLDPIYRGARNETSNHARHILHCSAHSWIILCCTLYNAHTSRVSARVGLLLLINLLIWQVSCRKSCLSRTASSPKDVSSFRIDKNSNLRKKKMIQQLYFNFNLREAIIKIRGIDFTVIEYTVRLVINFMKQLLENIREN